MVGFFSHLIQVFYYFVVHKFQVLRRWNTSQSVQEHGSDGCTLPQEPGDAALLQPLERRRLGHHGRPGQDGLEPGPLRGLLPWLQRRRLCVGRGEVLLLGIEGDLVGPVSGLSWCPEAQVGPPELHDLRLLQGHPTLPPRLRPWVLPVYLISI